MGSDPGGHQVWPFDPGLSQYAPVHIELPLFPPIWGASDSPPLLPAQNGWTKLLHYPYLLGIYNLHSSREAMGEHWVQGKVGGGPGEWRYPPFDPGSSHYKFGQIS